MGGSAETSLMETKMPAKKQRTTAAGRSMQQQHHHYKPSNDSNRHKNSLLLHQSSTTQQQQPHFLPFHFQVLKSLYLSTQIHNTSTGNKKGSTTASAGSSSTFQSMDDVVPSQAWALMETFLNHRSSLLECKHKASECRTIHQQSLEFDQKQASDETSTEAAQPKQSQRTTNKKRKRNQPEEEANKERDPSPPAVSLVSKLMQHRADKAKSLFQRRVHRPFAPLLQTTRHRISKLQDKKQDCSKRLQEQQQKISKELLSLHRNNTYTTTTTAADSHKQAAERAQKEQQEMQHERDLLVATESKIQLWTMLEQDLKQLFF